MPEEIRTPEPSNEMSFSDKFVGILSSPSEIYQQISTMEPKNSNWGLPVVFTLIMMLIYMFVVFNQAPIQDQMQDSQLKEMQKQVADGKMTQEEMDRAVGFMPKPGSPIWMIFGSVGIAIFVFASLFGFSLVYWIVGKFAFKSVVPYMKVCEVYGLSMYIAAVSSLIGMVFVVSMGSIYAGANLAMLVGEVDPVNKTHMFLSSINLFTLWQYVVIGIGFSKVWSVSSVKGILVGVGVWLMWTVLFSYGGALIGR
jgi:hypothetical protein